jgi:two-component system OmpR family response regulator
MGIIGYKHIFIVDDNEMFAEMLSDHLKKNPKFKVSVFHTGEECLQNIFQNPDLIILDFYLNDVSKDAIDGLEILTEIKKHNERIQVIMLSSQEHYGIALQTIAKGASQYVLKDDHAFEKIDHFLKELS